MLLDTCYSWYRKPFRRLWITFVNNFVLRTFDFQVGGQRLSKIGGSKERLRDGQCQKAGAVVWQWVPTIKVPPPPSPGKFGSRFWNISSIYYCPVFKRFSAERWAFDNASCDIGFEIRSLIFYSYFYIPSQR